MRVGVVGLNYLTAPFELRERMTDVCNRLIFRCPAVILTTCNRCEIYFSGEAIGKIEAHLMNVLETELGVDLSSVTYAHFERACFHHLVRVTSGLESAALGETEIQAQVKVAYEKTRVEKELPSDLHALFQKSLKIGKQMRNLHHFPGASEGIERVIERLLPKSCERILFVGNSAINRRLMGHFGKENEIAVVTRGDSRIKKEAMGNWENYDAVIAATKTDRYFIERYGGGEKKHLFDLAVPRNIAPAVGMHPDVELYNIDDLIGAMKRTEVHTECEAAVTRLIERNFSSWLSRGRGEMARCPVYSQRLS